MNLKLKCVQIILVLKKVSAKKIWIKNMFDWLVKFNGANIITKKSHLKIKVTVSMETKFTRMLLCSNYWHDILSNFCR